MAKRFKNLLPKKIAGVKVPKTVRRSQLGELLASPTGQKLIAEAIVAVGVAAAASAKKFKDSPGAQAAVAEAGEKLSGAKDRAGHAAAEASGRLAFALGEAVRSFTDALHREEKGDNGAGAEARWPELPSAREEPQPTT